MVEVAGFFASLRMTGTLSPSSAAAQDSAKQARAIYRPTRLLAARIARLTIEADSES